MSDVRLIQGDCLEVLPTLEAGSVDAVVTDPPYGTDAITRYGSRDNATTATPYKPIAGDDAPFDPSHLLDYPTVILFGANWYADKLPPSGGWIVWDKKDGTSSDDFSDAELAWVSNSNTIRIFRHLWRGMIKASERDQKRVHPMQKPVALYEWVLENYTVPGQTVLDPYMGSGSLGVACCRMGRSYVGIELDPGYFAIAQRRIAQAQAQLALPLFAAAERPGR